MARKKKDDIRRELVAVSTPQSPVAEQFRRLRTNLNFAASQAPLGSLIVTSANAGEGKSTVAANLAVVYAQEGKRVLLVDSDMRNPVAHKAFRMKNEIGLANILAGEAAAEAAIRKTAVENLDLLCCGPVPPNPSELLGSRGMDELLEKLERAYDLVIFDSPPVLSVVDGQILANKCGAGVLVIHSGKTDKGQALKAKEILASSRTELLGVILNDFKQVPEKSYR